MITLIHGAYKAFTTYNKKNAFTVSYENLIISTMNKINEGEMEQCKTIIRTVFYIYCIPSMILISVINRKFNVDFPLPIPIIFSFFIAMYGFLNIKNFTEIKTKMLQLIKYATILFIPVLFSALIFNFYLQFLACCYVGILLAFSSIILIAYVSFISGNFWVLVAKKIVKHSLSKQNKINVLVLQLELLFGIPIVLSVFFFFIKG